MGESFEEISYEFFECINKESKLPGYVFSYGRWWGNNPIEKQEEEIHFLEKGKTFLFLENLNGEIENLR